jgi:hypothetical protein
MVACANIVGKWNTGRLLPQETRIFSREPGYKVTTRVRSNLSRAPDTLVLG